MTPGTHRMAGDRPPYPRLAYANPRPVSVPPVPRPLTGAPLVLCWVGMVAGGWCMVAGLAWTAYAVCRVTGVCR